MRLVSRRALLGAGLGALLASACGGAARAQPSPSPRRPDSPLAANAELGVWPDVIAKAPREVREAYAYAARGPRSLRYIPCYCGCGAAGHRDNQDCYVKTFAAGGWVVLDLHGAG